MNLMRIAGGAAAGIGAVAMAPIFGPVLTVTAIGAAVGAAVGGAAAAATDTSVEPPDPVADDPEVRSRAERVARMEALEAQLTALRERQGEQRYLERTLTALFAVGAAAAWSDGDPDAEAWAELRQAITGLSWSLLPEGLRETIEGFFEAPVSFQEALAFVDASEPGLLDLLDEAIELAILLDDQETPSETAFREAWLGWRAEAAS